MATLLGVLMVVGGIAVLAIVRPWRPEPDEHEETPAPGGTGRASSRPAPRPKRPRPRPGNTRPASALPKRHAVEAIPRGRRVPPGPGREEITLPEWLGPVSR